MSNDNAGRTPRSSGGNAPMGSTVAIVVTAAAVILGFLILKKINDSGDDTSKPGNTTSTTIDTSTTLTFDNTSTTEPPLTTTGTKVQVANAASVGGVAGQLTTALSGVGFDMADATNASGAVLNTSKVVYDPNNAAALPVAQSVARVLGGIAVEPVSGTVPTKSGAFADGSGVVVLLGTDLAGKTLDQIAGVPTTGTTTPPTNVTAVPTTATPTT